MDDCTYCAGSGIIRVAEDGGQATDWPCPACRPDDHDEALRLVYDAEMPGLAQEAPP